MYKVVITDSDLGGVEIETDALGVGYELHFLQSTDPANIISAAENAVGLLVQRAAITAEVLEALPDLRAVVRYGMGVDNVDVEAAALQGVTVSGVSDYCVREVAEHAALFIAAVGRQVWHFQKRAQTGGWGRGSGPLPRLPIDDPVGIVGFGSIGRTVAERLSVVGHPIYVYDPYLDPNSLPGQYSRVSSVEVLAAKVNHLTLHSPLTESTRGMVSEDVLKKLGPEGHLVNTSRGGLVDEAALLRALDQNTLGHASLDVLSQEPPTEAMDRLFLHDRVTITPHVAYLGSRSLSNLRRRAAETLRTLVEEQEQPSKSDIAALRRVES